MDSNNQDNHPMYHRRENDNTDEVHVHYRHELAINSLEKRTDDLEKAMIESKPSIDYINSVITRNQKRAEFMEKMAYNLAGWGIMGVLTAVGGLFITVIWPALMIKLRQYLGGF